LKTRFTKITARNFKSLKSFELTLRPLNILIGPNASGKTNTLELFRFITKCLVPQETPSYPFTDWWGYSNIVWRSEENLPISFGLDGNYSGFNFSYRGEITGYGGKLKFISEEFDMKGVLKLTRKLDELSLTFDQSYLELIKEAFDDYSLDQKLYGIPADKLDINTLFVQKMQGMPEDISMLRSSSGWSASYSEKQGKRKDKFAIGYIHFRNQIMQMTDFVYISPMSQRTESVMNNKGKIVKESRFGSVFPEILNFINVNEMIFIRQINPSLVRQPSPLISNLDLTYGEGLTNRLFKWFTEKGGKLPDLIESALRELFPNFRIAFEITPDGRIMMNIYEGELKLLPPSIPDGLLKMLIILTAIELKPQILLIDEIENSLHAQLIEYLLSALKTSESTVMVTTHSPVVVDLADIEDLVLVSRRGYETKLERVENPEKVRKRLSEDGITVSDSWLYGKLQ